MDAVSGQGGHEAALGATADPSLRWMTNVCTTLAEREQF
jgi:hypothetical protein